MKKVHKKRIKRLLAALFVIALIGGVVFLGWSVKKFFVESSLFVVKNISTNIDDQLSARGQRVKLPANILGSKNLFSVDIKGLSRDLKSSYPQYKDIVVSRRFPDTLEIQFIERAALFQIELNSRFWFVDQEYIVISGPNLKPYVNMAVVHAVLPKRMRVFIGKKITFSHADRVRSLLKDIKTYGLLDGFSVASLYAYSLNDIWFDLNGMEIRVGAGDYPKKLDLLKRLILPRFKDDFRRIEYIDLRFKDYVVGYKR